MTDAPQVTLTYEWRFSSTLSGEDFVQCVFQLPEKMGCEIVIGPNRLHELSPEGLYFTHVFIRAETIENIEAYVKAIKPWFDLKQIPNLPMPDSFMPYLTQVWISKHDIYYLAYAYRKLGQYNQDKQQASNE